MFNTGSVSREISDFTQCARAQSNVYWKKSFLSTESDIKILQSIYFAYKVGIISSYSNRVIFYISDMHREIFYISDMLIKALVFGV